MSFIYCRLNFHANLLRPWRFPSSPNGNRKMTAFWDQNL